MLEKALEKILGKNRVYRAVFNTADGRKVLRDLVDYANLLNNTAIDPQTLAVMEGRRQVVRRVLLQINMTEDELIRAVKKRGHENE